MNEGASLRFSDSGMELAGEIDFTSVMDLQRRGDDWLREMAPAVCRLDMSGVTRCNSAGTALLLAWLRTAAGSGKSLRVEHPPESLSALMELAGLDEILQGDALQTTRRQPGDC